MENFDEADFSPAALFPELDEMQLLQIMLGPEGQILNWQQV